MRDTDACGLEEAAADCRKNSKEEDGKEENSMRYGAIKEYDGNKSL